MIDAPSLNAHRTAARLLEKGDIPRRIGRTKGGLNSKLHTVCDGDGPADHHGADRRPDERPQGRTSRP
ncbi:hypothetical protein [Xanthobacter sp.]|uniref:hypothetical protein n=1 Tax=Xanthobacter sp. TaxID=35809 RepID=UPI0025F6D8E6|nr:hypothetical protein [Xanthobacter sp.]